MKGIRLSQGETTWVDDEDFERLSQYRWYSLRRMGKVYARRKERRGSMVTTVLMHDDILGKKPGCWIDHANGNPLDNRRSNLRHCTRQQNVWNQGKQRRPTTSRFKGVCFDRRKGDWMAYINKDGTRTYLGRFASEEAAAAAYNTAAVERFGPFARLNELTEHPVNSPHSI